MRSSKEKCISGERISVTYEVRGAEKQALARAKDICFEQTVEFPEALIGQGFIRDYVVGRIESFNQEGDSFKAVISYAGETAAGEFTQLLSLIFGNISIKPGIRVCRLQLPQSILKSFKGPRFGKEGLRKFLGAARRPLLCTALKPMGLSSGELADLAYHCALGGIDVIKDDHGLTDQCFAPFEERVRLCAQAVAKANKKTGKKSVYVANITAPFAVMKKRAAFAKQAGAGGVMMAPGIIGFDLVRYFADDDAIALPVFSHPSFQGSYVINPDAGISHYVLFGQLTRLAGADAVIYPNFGGRFPFTRGDCEEIAAACACEMGHIKPIFPCPGGGMSLERIPELLKLYGNDVIFLIGGGLFTHGPGLAENCRHFSGLVNE
jgi:ribulose-bisphosphate carboxylase large chain